MMTCVMSSFGMIVHDIIDGGFNCSSFSPLLGQCSSSSLSGTFELGSHQLVSQLLAGQNDNDSNMISFGWMIIRHPRNRAQNVFH